MLGEIVIRKRELTACRLPLALAARLLLHRRLHRPSPEWLAVPLLLVPKSTALVHDLFLAPRIRPCAPSPAPSSPSVPQNQDFPCMCYANMHPWSTIVLRAHTVFRNEKLGVLMPRLQISNRTLPEQRWPRQMRVLQPWPALAHAMGCRLLANRHSCSSPNLSSCALSVSALSSLESKPSRRELILEKQSLGQPPEHSRVRAFPEPHRS